MPDEPESLASLNLRRVIARVAIRTVSTEEDPDAKEDALQYYNAQLAEIDRKIALLTGSPPPVTVGLKTADLTPVVYH